MKISAVILKYLFSGSVCSFVICFFWMMSGAHRPFTLKRAGLSGRNKSVKKEKCVFCSFETEYIGNVLR